MLFFLYRGFMSPFLRAIAGPGFDSCRFIPTCSQYSEQAFQTHSPHKAIFLTIKRLLRCHPFQSVGPHYDPVGYKK